VSFNDSLKRCVIATLCLSLGVAATIGCSSEDGRVRVGLDQLRPNAPLLLEEHHVYVVRLTDTGEEQILALSGRSPWSGCDVLWAPQEVFEAGPGEAVTGVFVDPCSGGSKFALDGRRLFGPTPTGLDSFAGRVEGDEFLVDLGALVCATHPPVADFESTCEATMRAM
jgi:hypothetical protein